MQTEKDTIEIISKNDHWYARFHGDHRLSALRCFGIDTLPTGYGMEKPREYVVERMRIQNRGCTVF